MKEVEEQISQRKAEVEKLIREMREANMESLAISPPEESKQFLDGEKERMFAVIFLIVSWEIHRLTSKIPSFSFPPFFSRMQRT